MLKCFRCGRIAYRNSHFGIVQCGSCGWRVTVPQYEREEQKRKGHGTTSVRVFRAARREESVGEHA